MDLRQLTYFLAIVDNGGYHRAAQKLLVSQPSLSQSMANLEKELGVALFHRLGRGVVLSQAGEDLVGRARVVVREVEAARSVVLKHRGLQAGRVDLVTMPSPGIEPLTSLTRQFHDAYPELSLTVHAAFTAEEVVESIGSGSAEVGLIGQRSLVRSARLDVLELAPQALVLVVAPALDTFGDVTSLAPGDLAGHSFVVSPEGSLMRWLVDEVVALESSTRVVAEVSHRTSILPLVMAGIGHAVLPSAWRSMAEACGLRTLEVHPQTVLRTALVSRRDRLTPAAEAFMGVALALAR